MGWKRGKSAWGSCFVKASGMPRQNGLDLHSEGGNDSTESMPKQSRRPPPDRKSSAQPVRMTTGEAVVASLLAHGIDTVYALPGVHNDHFFDALYKAGNRVRVVHTRHEQGCGLYGAGRGARDRQAADLLRGAGTGPAQYRRRPPDRLFHECAGAGADRPDPARRDPARSRPSARNPRPGRHHRTAGRSFRPHPARRPTPRAWSRRRSSRCSPTGPGRPRSNARSTSGAATEPVADCAPLAAFEPPIDDDAVDRGGRSCWARPKIR